MRQGHTIGDRELWSQVRDHAADMVFAAAKMETPLPGFTVSFLGTLPLHEEFAQRHISGSKYAEIPVHRHDPFIRLQG